MANFRSQNSSDQDVARVLNVLAKLLHDLDDDAVLNLSIDLIREIERGEASDSIAKSISAGNAVSVRGLRYRALIALASAVVGRDPKCVVYVGRRRQKALVSNIYNERLGNPFASCLCQVIRSNALVSSIGGKLRRVKSTVLQVVRFPVNLAQKSKKNLKARLQTVGNLAQSRYSSLCGISLLRPVKDEAVRGRALPLISIVIPSFNQGAFIEATLDSVFSQGYPSLRVHVQDGGSTDQTRSILDCYAKKYPKQLTFESCLDNGQADAINRGFARLDGDIMAWLNSDDLLLPGVLGVVASKFQSRPDVDVVYGDRLLVDAANKIVGRWRLPSHSDGDLRHAFWVPQETMFWRKSAWDAAGGGVDSRLRFAMDWDLVLKFVDAGCTVVHLPYFMGALRVYPQQKTQELIESVGLREMDFVRLSHGGCGLVPRCCKAHQAAVRMFFVRQKIASARSEAIGLLVSLAGNRFGRLLGLEMVNFCPAPLP